MKRSVGKTIIVLVFLAALMRAAQGPGSYPIVSGTTTDAEGAVIPGVQIVAVNLDRHITLKATTNQAGSFRFAPLALGNYEIQIKSRKWMLEPVKVTVEISSDIKLDLKLEPKGK